MCVCVCVCVRDAPEAYLRGLRYYYFHFILKNLIFLKTKLMGEKAKVFIYPPKGDPMEMKLHNNQGTEKCSCDTLFIECLLSDEWTHSLNSTNFFFFLCYSHVVDSLVHSRE